MNDQLISDLAEQVSDGNKLLAMDIVVPTVKKPDSMTKEISNQSNEVSKSNVRVSCQVCGKQFRDSRAMKFHPCHRLPRPDWMPQSTYKNAFRAKIGSKPCPGCGKNLPLIESRHPSFEYLIHVVEECSPCLNIVKECKECNFKFVSSKSLNRHLTSKHSSTDKPDWMTKKIFVNSKIASRKSNISVPCQGCGRELERVKGNGSYRFEDYVHMVEECEEYKKLQLIRTCKRCKGKFISTKAYGNHKC